MRCSHFAFTLLAAAITAGTLGVASANNRVAAEFGTHPSFWSSANRFESVKDWRSYKFMEEMINLRSKDAYLLPLPYKIVIAQAGIYAFKYNGEHNSDVLNLKSIFSPKMLSLLSTRWADKTSSLSEFSSENAGGMNLTASKIAGMYSADMADNANAAHGLSPKDWQLGEWATSYFSQSFDFDAFIGVSSLKSDKLPTENGQTSQSATQPISSPTVDSNTNTNKKDNGNDAPHRNDTTNSFFSDFYDYAYDEDCDNKFSPQHNGSFGYDYHANESWTNHGKDDFTASWQSRFADLCDLFESMTASVDEFAVNGYAEEQYSVKYGNAVEETAVSPQSTQSNSNGMYCNNAVALVKHYFADNDILRSAIPVDTYSEMIFSYSNVPVKISPNTIFFDASAVLPGLSGNGLNPLAGQNTMLFETSIAVPANSPPMANRLPPEPLPAPFSIISLAG